LRKANIFTALARALRIFSLSLSLSVVGSWLVLFLARDFYSPESRDRRDRMMVMGGKEKFSYLVHL